jgi:hypothetical protein
LRWKPIFGQGAVSVTFTGFDLTTTEGQSGGADGLFSLSRLCSDVDPSLGTVMSMLAPLQRNTLRLTRRPTGYFFLGRPQSDLAKYSDFIPVRTTPSEG